MFKDKFCNMTPVFSAVHHQGCFSCFGAQSNSQPLDGLCIKKCISGWMCEFYGGNEVTCCMVKDQSQNILAICVQNTHNFLDSS